MKKYYRAFCCLAVLALCCKASDAQQMLTLDEALKLALQNNYAIQVAKNDAEVARINNAIGAAGMLPAVTGTLSQDNQKADTKQQYLDGRVNNVNNAKTTQTNANVELGWTIFNGMRMFATKNRLESLQQIGELRMRQSIELTFSRVIRAYHDVVLAKQQLKANDEAIAISEERLQLAKDLHTAGRSARTELLTAQVDLNTDKSAFIRQQNQLRNTKVALNQLLAREVSTDFDVADTVVFKSEYKLDEVMNKTLSQNSSIQIAKKNQEVNFYSLREARGDRYPVLQLRTGYNYAKQESESGFLQSSTSNGYHYGAGASLNVFNGFDVNRRVQVAKVNIRSSELLYRDSVSRIQTSIQQAFNNFIMSKQLVDFERENLEVAQDNFGITEEQYKVGVITAIQLRDAQQNLLDTRTRLITAQYETKLNETELLRLSGDLFQLVGGSQ